MADRLAEASQKTPRRRVTVTLAFAAAIALVTLLAASYWFAMRRAPAIFAHDGPPDGFSTGAGRQPVDLPDGLWISVCIELRRPTVRSCGYIRCKADRPSRSRPTGWLCRGRPPGRRFQRAGLRGLETLPRTIYRVSRTGGVPSRIAECKSRSIAPCEVDWSPEGKTLAVADREDNHSCIWSI